MYGEIIRLYDSENTVVTPVESGNGDNKQEGQQTITSIPPKVIHTVKNIKDLVVNTDKSLVETEDDVDRYLAQLKISMLEAIKSGQHILVK